MSEERATTEEIGLLLKYISKGYKVPPILHDEVLTAAKREIEDKKRVVLIKRDPNLHRGRIQAAYVRIIEGNTMQMHPATVGPYGADFDGDTMAIFVPISEEAQQEAKDKMLSATGTSTINSTNFRLTNEMLTGIMTLTSTEVESQSKTITDTTDVKSMHIGQKVKIKIRGETIDTTAGKVIFNQNLPPWYKFINEPVSKSKLDNIMDEIIEKSQSDFVKTIDNLMRIAFYYATVYPKSFGLDMINLNAKLKQMKEELPKLKSISDQSRLLNEMDVELLAHMKKNIPELYLQIASGSAKGGEQIRQIMLCKGIIADASGNILPPINKSITDGFTPEEYFNAASGSRKGVIDKSINTGSGGYSYRKLIYVVGDVELNKNIKDCGTQRTLDLKLTPALFKKLKGRYILESNKIKSVSKDLVGQTIHLRSPIFCETREVCQICYGDLYKQLNTKNIGIVAAQEMQVAERIMKCADGLIHHDNRLIAMSDLFDSINSPIETENGVERKSFDSFISGKNGDVKTYSIEKHMPRDKMLFISTKSGHTIICQANHPLWIKENKLHDKYENKTCRLIGNKSYMSTGSGSSVDFTINDETPKEIQANDLQKYDAIWVDNSYSMNNQNDIEPELNGYLVGMYCGDGNLLEYNDRWTKGFQITQENGDIKNRLLNESYQFEDTKIYDGSIIYKDKYKKMHSLVLGRYSYEKHLEPNFINYSKEWLLNFLSGLIDSDGTIFNNGSGTGTGCRIYTSSYYLVQQLKAISLKLGYRMNTCLVPRNKEGSKSAEHRRIHFACDIRFHKNSPIPNSEKIKNFGVVIPIKGNYKNEFPEKGYDVVTCIKELWTWNYPVFDIKTETNEFLLNGVQNHNSFHLGGAVNMKSVDIINELMTNVDDVLLPTLQENVVQEKDTVNIKADYAMARLDKNLFSDIPYKRDKDKLTLPVGYFYLNIGTLNIKVTIEQETVLYLTEDIEEDNTNLNIIYGKDDKLISVYPKPKDYTKLASVVDQLISGKSPYADIPSLYLKFMKGLYVFDEPYDSCHIEVLISNILRDKEDPSKLARLKMPYNPTLVSIKSLPSLISWPLGFAFENFGRAISMGLISDRSPSSPIEKVMFGEPLVDEEKYRQKKR